MSANRSGRNWSLRSSVHRIVDSIKFRVVLSASLLFTLFTLVVSVVAVQVWAGKLESNRTEDLRGAADVVCAALAESPSGVDFPLPAPQGNQALVSYRVSSALIVDSGVLNAGEVPATVPAACRGSETWDVIPSTGSGPDTLSMIRRVTLSDVNWSIMVSMPMAAAQDDIAQVANAIRVGVPLLVVVVAVLLWLVTAQALRPVTRIAEQSEQISLGTLDQRLPDPVHDDEIADLTSHLNGMLDRLERASDAQHQFISDASHELRSPVATILAISEHPAPASEEIGVIHSEASRLSALVDALIELARAQEGTSQNRESFALDEMLLEDAERILVPAERRGVTIDTTDVRSVSILASRAAVSGIVRNLVDNAVRHARSEVVLACAVEGSWALVSVSDDGPGIPEDQRDRVFERFVRLDTGRARSLGGTGLGLALVKELVQAHGGEVWVSNSSRGGAAFQLRLPLNPPA